MLLMACLILLMCSRYMGAGGAARQKLHSGVRSTPAQRTVCLCRPSSWAREGWGVLLHDRGAVCHLPGPRGPDTTHAGIAVTVCLLGPKQHWVCRKKIFACLCCHLSCVPLLQNKPSATGYALHLHPLLQTILPQPPASAFPGNTPWWWPKAGRKAGVACCSLAWLHPLHAVTQAVKRLARARHLLPVF